MRQRRPGVWEYRYELGRDPVTGERRRRSKTVHGTRDDAERDRAKTLGEIADGRYNESDRQTFSDFTRGWLEVVEPTIRPSTFEGYRMKIRKVNTYIGNRELADLTGPVLSALYRRMLEDGLSRQSVATAHRVIHRALRDAARWKILRHNPAADADPPRVTRPKIRTWSEDDVARMLELTADSDLFPIWRLAATTGMRRGEILGLRWPAVDLQEAVLDVLETRVMVAGRPVAGEPKTSAGRRRVALDAVTVQLLEEHQARQNEDRELFGADYAEGEWVFAWPDGRPYSPDWVGKKWRAMIRSSDLPEIRFHDLRHTWATIALKAGVPAKVVSDRLGHAGIRITLDTYTHHVDELDREAADRVSELFGTRESRPPEGAA